MFGGYDPAYNPENLEAKKNAEKKEVSQEQMEVANKWAAAMEGVGEQPTAETAETAENLAEALVEAVEAEGEIPETEPQLQHNLEEHTDLNIANDHPDPVVTFEDEVAAAEQHLEEEGELGELEEADENTPESEVIVGRDGKKYRKKPKGHGGTDSMGRPMDIASKVSQFNENDAASVAMELTGASVITDAINIATETMTDGLGEAKLANKAVDALFGMADNLTDAKGEEGEEGEGESESEDLGETTPTSESISHYPEDATDNSDFNPLSPEEQRDQAARAEAEHQKTYSEPGEADTPYEENNNGSNGDNDPNERKDPNNLVAQEVGQNLSDTSIDLNGVGANLEGKGVDISDEVDHLDADIAYDRAQTAQDGLSEDGKDTDAANNLAVDAGATALAAKESAAVAEEAVERGSADADLLLQEAQEKAAFAQSIAGEARDAASAAAVNGTTDILTQATEMADAAAKSVEDSKQKLEDKTNGEEEDSTPNNPAFSAAKYPELNDLDGGTRTSIFTK